jgi:Tfp pilus assembly protein PilX
VKVRASSGQPRAQGGVALIVALIILMVIGLTSASVMRGALSADMVANNNRVQTLATQAAQIALRYCERQSELDAGGTQAALPPAPPAYWSDHAHWSEERTGIYEVPIDYMQSEDGTRWSSPLPQCMTQRISVGPGKTGYQVTARGFSPGYEADQNGRTDAGAVVWLQSTIYLN